MIDHILVDGSPLLAEINYCPLSDGKAAALSRGRAMEMACDIEGKG